MLLIVHLWFTDFAEGIDKEVVQSCAPNRPAGCQLKDFGDENSGFECFCYEDFCNTVEKIEKLFLPPNLGDYFNLLLSP